MRQWRNLHSTLEAIYVRLTGSSTNCLGSHWRHAQKIVFKARPASDRFVVLNDRGSVHVITSG